MTEKRDALIIATNQYEDSDLRKLVSPAHDAEALETVLKDPVIGGFDVKALLNRKSYEVKQVVEAFFSNRKRDDLLLIYFSGHGIKDEEGHLYFSSTETKRALLLSTAIEANFINTVMKRSRSRRQILMLDCCYSGAFARGMLAKADKAIGTRERFEGSGRVVLTASDAMQYAFEGSHVEGKAEPSVFTNIIVHGLKTGEADIDGDGIITLDELYEYVHGRVIDRMSGQSPQKWNLGVQGKIVIAKNPNPVVKPVALPSNLLQSANDTSRPKWEREGAVRELSRLLNGADKGIVISAREALIRLKEDDSRLISTEAAKVIDEFEKREGLKKTEKSGKKVSVDKTEDDVKAHKDLVAGPIKKFRSTSVEKLSMTAVKSMIKEKGFFDSDYNKSVPGFSNSYETQHNGEAIYDRASGLMWQQSGSDKHMNYKAAKKYITQLNSDQFAGHNDWRLPTLEEAMTLMEPEQNSDDLYIGSIFDSKQRWIWTSDMISASRAWVVYFNCGGCNVSGIGSNDLYVRAVR
ncbi:MAG: DUF1566 domain-containing protein [Candidatus Brocadiaceae bacterium]|nr:DUF1566 domain-containing protein [Candidatus Brocadiaceae bacterium]